MFRNPTRRGRWTAIALAILLWCSSQALAKKPPQPPGGDEETARFSVIELPGFDCANAVSNPDENGLVTVAGTGFAMGVPSWATYAVVHVITREVVSGSLPVPPDVQSDGRDANSAGVIVGRAGVAPIRWIPTDAGYDYELLPLLDGDWWGEVNAVNDAGEMVGKMHDSGAPVYWDADAVIVIDLNLLLPEGSTWILVDAYDINNNGQVVGSGFLDGVERGFVFDLNTLTIEAVPLVEGPVVNRAVRINEAGHVVGIGGGGPFPPGGGGFFWGGPGTDPQLVPLFADAAGLATGINNHDELAGHCRVPGDLFSTWMTLWEPSEDGGFTVTDMGTQVPTKPTWDLSWGLGINDDLWIAGRGCKFFKGKYSWHGVLVVPNP